MKYIHYRSWVWAKIVDESVMLKESSLVFGEFLRLEVAYCC